MKGQGNDQQADAKGEGEVHEAVFRDKDGRPVLIGRVSVTDRLAGEVRIIPIDWFTKVAEVTPGVDVIGLVCRDGEEIVLSTAEAEIRATVETWENAVRNLKRAGRIDVSRSETIAAEAGRGLKRGQAAHRGAERGRATRQEDTAELRQLIGEIWTRQLRRLGKKGEADKATRGELKEHGINVTERTVRRLRTALKKI